MSDRLPSPDDRPHYHEASNELAQLLLGLQIAQVAAVRLSNRAACSDNCATCHDSQFNAKGIAWVIESTRGAFEASLLGTIALQEKINPWLEMLCDLDLDTEPDVRPLPAYGLAASEN